MTTDTGRSPSGWDTTKLVNDMTVIRDIAEVDRAYPAIDLLVRVLDEAIGIISGTVAESETPQGDHP